MSRPRLVTDADAETMQIPAGFEEAYEVAVEYTDRLLATRSALMEGFRQTTCALRVALHYTEVDYDDEGAEELVGCRIAEQQARALLAELHGEKP